MYIYLYLRVSIYFFSCSQLTIVMGNRLLLTSGIGWDPPPAVPVPFGIHWEPDTVGKWWLWSGSPMFHFIPFWDGHHLSSFVMFGMDFIRFFFGKLGWGIICSTSAASGAMRRCGRTQVQKLRSMGLRQRDVQDVLNEACLEWPVKLLLFF